MATSWDSPDWVSPLFSMQSVYEKLKIWRLVASLFAFSSTPELIFGAALLYYFRVFERQIGSNKYAVSHFVLMDILIF
jgi:hypothetical protein